jgi:hypothetical protein
MLLLRHSGCGMLGAVDAVLSMMRPAFDGVSVPLSRLLLVLLMLMLLLVLLPCILHLGPPLVHL